MAQSIRSSADVVIVGAGIAAGMIARKLAQQGIDVLMVEAGDRIERWRIVENFRNSAFKGDRSALPHERARPTSAIFTGR